MGRQDSGYALCRVVGHTDLGAVDMITAINAILQVIIGFFITRRGTSSANSNTQAPKSDRDHVADKLRDGAKGGTGPSNRVP